MKEPKVDMNNIVHRNPANWEHYSTGNLWVSQAMDSSLMVAAGISMFFAAPNAVSIVGWPLIIGQIIQGFGVVMAAYGIPFTILNAYGIFEHRKHDYVRCTHCHAIVCRICKEVVSGGDL